VPQDLDARLGRMLLADITAHLPEATFVTRDDCLFLPCMESWATITRYAYVCRAVNWLIAHNELVPKSRTDLCLASRQGEYDDELNLADRYGPTVRRIVLSQREPFTLMDIVRSWERKSDQHLTQNTRRAATRSILRRLAHDGLIEQQEGSYHWSKVERRNAA